MEENKNDSEKSNSSEEEKPMKKARYIWEIKGKQHMKTPIAKIGSEQIVDKSLPSCSKLEPSYENSKIQSSETNKTLDKSNTKSVPLSGRLQTSGDGKLGTQVGAKQSETVPPQSSFTIHTVEGNAVETIGGALNPVEPGLRRCCFDSMIERSGDVLYEAMEDIFQTNYGSDEDTESQNKNSSNTSNTSSRHDDFLILKWQAHQIARGYADNVINTMLESEMYEREAREVMYEGGSHIEHEAIFEAIKTHGLQSNSESGESSQEKRCDLPVQDEDRAKDGSCRTENSSLNKSNVSTTSKISSPAGPKLLTSETDDETFVAEECQNSDVSADPMDFLNAAVSVAIQKKGLTCG